MIKVIEKAKIKTEEISFQTPNSQSADIMVQSFDYVPYVYIRKLNDTTTNPPIIGTSIDPKTDIIYLKLHNSHFLPEIELFCTDSKGILFNDLYPFDNDTLLCIFVKSNSDNIMPIRMDFKIIHYETINSGEPTSFKYLIKGILNVEHLYYTRYETYKGTSYDVIKGLAAKMDLGFASNVNSSNDSMTWINPSDTYLDLINDITKYSFISEDSIVWSFIDFYYNINYIDIQTELNEFNEEEEGTLTNPQIVKNDEERNVILYLTNNKALNMTNKYISKFNLVNQSSKVNLNIYYQIEGTWYDKTTNVVTKQFIKELESDSAKLSAGEGTLRQLIDKGSALYKENVNDEYFIGKMDEDNVHKNYSLAKIANNHNLDSLEKMKMVVTLSQINFSIKRFQNIKIEIYNYQDLLSQSANKNNPLDNINTKLSGYWFVTGINYIYRKSGGHEQELTLVRRDLSLDYGTGNDQRNDLRSLKK